MEVSISEYFSVASGTIKNVESARISTPITLVEEGKDEEHKTYIWRTDLLQTKDFWEEWFKGLSKSFLAVPLPKQLIMAGSDRLDKELIIGQMQGKFKYQIITESGHIVQEDNPKALAKSFKDFIAIFHIHEKADHQEVITSASGKKVYIRPG